MDKGKVVAVLEEIGLLLEIKGENQFKTRAYENGARIIGMLDEDLETLVKEKRLGTIKGIGKALEQKIEELVTTGGLVYYEELKADFPPGIFELLKVPGLGAKKVRVLYQKLDIGNLGELEYSCLENRLVDLPGFGKKTQENILKGIAHLKQNAGKYLQHEAGAMAVSMLYKLKECPEIEEISIAGSLRRRKEIIKDIDMLVSSHNADKVMEYVTALPDIKDVIGSGGTKTSIRLQGGIAVDVRVVSPSQYPYALHHFTGSKEHNTKMRHIAKSRGIKMNEYGLFQGDEEKLIHCKDETEIFKALDMDYIAPELREDMGEIEAALEGGLPELIKDNDIRGIFHIHSTYSDGDNSIKELAKEAIKLGYGYMGISDHSRSAFYANGINIDNVIKQHEEIDRLNETFKDFKILKGIESDILHDGGLDYPDEILKSFDFIIASVHSGFKMNREAMTALILKAMDNPYTTILGHPTGRLLLSRDGYDVDLDRIIKKAVEQDVIIEINANPHRLDLDWRWCKKAKEMGVRLVISPDAHDAAEFYNIGFGVSTARKGWLEKKDVINCFGLEELKKVLSKRH